MYLEISASLTIDEIATLIFTNIKMQRFKDEFDLSRERLISFLRKCDPIFLSHVTKDLEAYSMLDLLLLENILDIKFLVDDRNFIMTTFLDLDLFFLEISNLTIEFNKINVTKFNESFDWKKTLNNILQTVQKKYNTFNIENKEFKVPTVKKVTNSYEDAQDSGCKLEKESAEKIDITYDVDGYFLSIYTYVEGNIKVNLQINLHENSPEQVFSKKAQCFKTSILLRDLFVKKIGELVSHFGRASVFFVSHDEIDYKQFFNNVCLSAGKKVIDINRLEVTISCNLMCSFFSKLQSFYRNSFFFLESYGNKKFYCHTSFKSVFISLRNLFSKKIILDMTLDIGISFNSSLKKILFLGDEGFRSLRVSPNYNLFFCSRMANFNKRFISKSGDMLLYEFGPIYKLNIYSLIEDTLIDIRKRSFLPDFSFDICMSNLHGFCFKKKNINGLEKVFGRVFEKLELENSIGYRVEFTTKGMFIPIVYNIFFKFIQRNFFFSMDLALFSEIVTYNIKKILTNITGNSIFDLGRNIILETILKESY